MKNTLLGIVTVLSLALALVPDVPLANDVIVRERIVNMSPESESINPAGQARVNIDHDSFVELDASYFFNKSWAAEFSVTAFHPNTISTLDGSNLGQVWIVPPTLTAQYYPFPEQPIFRPYVGAGFNYLFISSSTSANGHTVHFDESNLNPVFQVGSDVMITKNWLLNVDAKYVILHEDIQVDAHPKIRNDISPWIFGVGVGYKF